MRSRWYRNSRPIPSLACPNQRRRLEANWRRHSEQSLPFDFFSRWALCQDYSLHCRAKVGGTRRMRPPPQPRGRGFDFRCIWKNITVYFKRRHFWYVWNLFDVICLHKLHISLLLFLWVYEASYTIPPTTLDSREMCVSVIFRIRKFHQNTVSRICARFSWPFLVAFFGTIFLTV